MVNGGFLIRRSSAIRRFIAGFLKCNSRTIMKSFPQKIAGELTGNLHKHPTKFSENSRAIFLRNDFIIVRLSHLRNPAINLRIAELRLMRNPPLISLGHKHINVAVYFKINFKVEICSQTESQFWPQTRDP